MMAVLTPHLKPLLGAYPTKLIGLVRFTSETRSRRRSLGRNISKQALLELITGMIPIAY